ncbi:hypothetical protein KEM55_009347 [Ascosphaera atra]|nr:hypothetical protein KEM55_009347 [Ascosphaera atra]
MEAVFGAPATGKNTNTDETPGSAFRKELAGLIQQGKLNLQIDQQNDTMVKVQSRTREKVYEDVLRNVQEFTDKSQWQLQHMEKILAGEKVSPRGLEGNQNPERSQRSLPELA